MTVGKLDYRAYTDLYDSVIDSIMEGTDGWFGKKTARSATRTVKNLRPLECKKKWWERWFIT